MAWAQPSNVSSFEMGMYGMSIKKSRAFNMVNRVNVEPVELATYIHMEYGALTTNPLYICWHDENKGIGSEAGGDEVMEKWRVQREEAVK